VNALPRRIVSLVPSTTESVCVLGAGERLVGCTRYCTEPAAELARVARVGGTKNPAREQVLALAPDLVLANAEENRPEDIEWFAGRVPVLVQTPRTVPEAAADLRALAIRLGAADAVQPTLWRLEAWLAAAAAEALGQVPLRVYYAIWQKPWMSVNRDTFVHDVMQRLGLHNVCAEAPARYPEFAPAAAVAAGVDVVLLASEPWEFDAAQRDAFAAAGTFGAARLSLCDGRDFCWHGVRMADGLGRALEVVRGLRQRRR
jgi:ABC-type Fe3+-hydroxamate transport system substrate-binding protein